jgi:hypothetical protein
MYEFFLVGVVLVQLPKVVSMITIKVLTIFFVKISLSMCHVLNVRIALCTQQNLWLGEFGAH